MLPLQRVRDILCLLRARQLEDAERGITQGYYLLVTAPLKSGISTFLKTLKQRLNGKYPNWLVLHLELTDEVNVTDQLDTELSATQRLPQQPGRPEKCDDECCFLEKLKSVNIISQSPGRVIIMLDSFHKASSQEQKDLLESLRITYYKRQECEILRKIVFILGGTVNMDLIDPGRTSPFFASYEIRLPDFSFEETRNFMRQFFVGYGITLPEPVELYLYDMTLGHPYLLNTLGKLISDRMSSGSTLLFSTVQRSIRDIASGRDEIMNLLKSEIRKSEPEVIDLLVRIMSGSLVHESQNPYLAELMRQGVISSGDRGFVRIRNPIFEHFLRTDKELANNVFSGKVAPAAHVEMNTAAVNKQGFHLLLRVESSLRTFIACKLFAIYGDNWPNNIPPSILKGLNKRRDNDTPSDQDPLLCYAFLNDLKEIIFSQWDTVFEKYFGTKQRLEVFLDSLRLIRNKVAHCRNLTDTELSKFEAIIQYFYEFMAHTEP